MYKIIQCRTTETGTEKCNQIAETSRIKEARGLQKMHFNSHIEMLARHEFDAYWDDFDINSEDFILIAYNSERKIIYSYRVVIQNV